MSFPHEHPEFDDLLRIVAGNRTLPFVRHFEDAAGIIGGEKDLPRLEGYDGARVLAEEMLASRQLAALPSAGDEAFRPVASDRFKEIRRAHEAIAPIFWGQRVELDEACARIRGWIAKRLSKT